MAKRLSPRSSAVILSGGFDSSVVSAVAAGVAPPGAQVRTFSGIFPGEAYDESAEVARSMSESASIRALWRSRRRGRYGLPCATRHRQLPLIAAGSLVEIAATQTAAVEVAEVV